MKSCSSLVQAFMPPSKHAFTSRQHCCTLQCTSICLVYSWCSSWCRNFSLNSENGSLTSVDKVTLTMVTKWWWCYIPWGGMCSCLRVWSTEQKSYTFYTRNINYSKAIKNLAWLSLKVWDPNMIDRFPSEVLMNMPHSKHSWTGRF